MMFSVAPTLGRSKWISPPTRLVGLAVDKAVPLLDGGSQSPQSREMEIDGPGSDRAAPGLGDLDLTQPAEEGPITCTEARISRTGSWGASGWSSRASI